MAPAYETLRAMGCPVVCTPNPAVRRTLDLKKRPCIVIGYGSLDPQERSMHHMIMKYYNGKRGTPCFGMVEAQGAYPSKHTRVSIKNIKIFDPNLPIFKGKKDENAKKLMNFLKDYYDAHVVDADEGLKVAKANLTIVSNATDLTDDCEDEEDSDTDNEAASGPINPVKPVNLNTSGAVLGSGLAKKHMPKTVKAAAKPITDVAVHMTEANDEEGSDTEDTSGATNTIKPVNPNTGGGTLVLDGVETPANIAAVAKQTADFAKMNEVFTANANMITTPVCLAGQKEKVLAKSSYRYNPY